jgi:two-component system response regulator RegA
MSHERPPILIVEDDLELREGLELELGDRGFEVVGGSSLRDIADDDLPRFELAVLDLRLDRENGLQALEKIKQASPNCRVVLMTGYGSIATAVEAMKMGAHNYLTKPVTVDDVLDALFDEESVDERRDKLQDEDQLFRTSLARHEKEYIEYVLMKCNGNITRAAEWLGIRRQSLQRKLKKYPPRK